ncbi:MAG: hypothetical protein ACI8Z1_000335 [Candidatus Azotimanducaceae bacterium]|jgi:hypothetical protein
MDDHIDRLCLARVDCRNNVIIPRQIPARILPALAPQQPPGQRSSRRGAAITSIPIGKAPESTTETLQTGKPTHEKSSVKYQKFGRGGSASPPTFNTFEPISGAQQGVTGAINTSICRKSSTFFIAYNCRAACARTYQPAGNSDPARH